MNTYFVWHSKCLTYLFDNMNKTENIFWNYRIYNLFLFFSMLWKSSRYLFTPRDELSFGYVVYRLGGAFKFFMFWNCKYNSPFVLHLHTREHSSKVEWVKSISEFKGSRSSMKESRGGLGLWIPYPGELDSVVLPPVVRTSRACWVYILLCSYLCELWNDMI